jgi:hypothetical protein
MKCKVDCGAGLAGEDGGDQTLFQTEGLFAMALDDEAESTTYTVHRPRHTHCAPGV